METLPNLICCFEGVLYGLAEDNKQVDIAVGPLFLAGKRSEHVDLLNREVLVDTAVCNRVAPSTPARRTVK